MVGKESAKKPRSRSRNVLVIVLVLFIVLAHVLVILHVLVIVLVLTLKKLMSLLEKRIILIIHQWLIVRYQNGVSGPNVEVENMLMEKNVEREHKQEKDELSNDQSMEARNVLKNYSKFVNVLWVLAVENVQNDTVDMVTGFVVT